MLNPRQRAVLAALVRGPVDPGALGDRLELPGTTVIDHIDTLRGHGFTIERGPSGFVLEAIPDYGYGVQAGLDAPFVVEYEPSIQSTNARARKLAAAGQTDVVVLANEQTRGRGRLHREWTSPPGGIYCSVLIRPVWSPDRLPLLTLAAAVAAIGAVAEVGVEATAKWPNDVVGPDGGKLAGILAESATTAGAVEWAVVGIGLNANVGSGDLPLPATSLQSIVGHPIDRRVVTRAFLESFDAHRRDPDGIVDAWRAVSATLSRDVKVRTAGGQVVGVAIDVDEVGGLLVEADDGIHRIAAGDCEHLRPTGAD